MMICSNEGFVTLCQQVEGASLTRLFLHLTKGVALLDSGSSMLDLSVVAVLLRSLGVGLCWNSKDYWCLKEKPARSFLAIGKTSVTVTILKWCWPWIHDIILCPALMQRHVTADWGRPASSFYPNYCTWSVTCLCTNVGWVYLFFSAKFNFTVSFFDLYLYINAYHGNKEIMKTNKEIYSVL